jgi:ABC-type thiamin/hydroxymethylpyrimidine transport system permease subunit
VISYLIGQIFKVIILKKKSKYKYIPIIVGITGGILGLVNEILYPVFNNYLESIMIGIISGLASTGANQIIKQMKEGEKNEY